MNIASVVNSCVDMQTCCIIHKDLYINEQIYHQKVYAYDEYYAIIFDFYYKIDMLYIHTIHHMKIQKQITHISWYKQNVHKHTSAL